MSYLRKFLDFFWNEYIWLPPGTTWEDIGQNSKTHPDIQHADYRHLFWPIPMAFVILILRFVVER